MAKTLTTATTLGELIEATMAGAEETYGDDEFAAIVAASLLFDILEEETFESEDAAEEPGWRLAA